ncbi:TPA: hypothetical protein ACGY72_002174 [Stenotrophomonas maltophilia]
MRILDIKGRRKRPRVHVVPLIKPSLADLVTMQCEKLGDFVFTITDGSVPVTYDIFRGTLDRVVDEMAAAGELDDRRFTPGDLRRTVETRLAAAGFSEESLATSSHTTSVACRSATTTSMSMTPRSVARSPPCISY